MSGPPAGKVNHPGLGLFAATVVSAGIVIGGRAVMPWEKMFPDFICYYAAGEIVASGKSPYDAGLQTLLQHRLGWDKESDGRGVYEFLPYYYPIWFAMGCVPLVPLGYDLAKMAWFFLNTWLLIVSGLVLHRAVPEVPRTIPIVLIPVFFFSVQGLILGQTAIMMLFLIALAWWLMERGWDRASGMALAGLVTKPQLTAVLLLAVLIWAVRRRRWRVVQAFFATLAVLSIAGALVQPAWPIQMWNAAKQTPLPTEHFPWIGASWLLVLKAAGLRSWPLCVAYLAVAVPIVLAAIGAAWRRERPLRDALALSLLAALFAVPYARHYDYPVILVPLLVLLAGRLSEHVGAVLVMALTFLPYVQFGVMFRYGRMYSSLGFYPECTYFWVPLVVAVAWLLTRAQPLPRAQLDENPKRTPAISHPA
jgi:hypothetical protein